MRSSWTILQHRFEYAQTCNEVSTLWICRCCSKMLDVPWRSQCTNNGPSGKSNRISYHHGNRLPPSSSKWCKKHKEHDCFEFDPPWMPSMLVLQERLWSISMLKILPTRMSSPSTFNHSLHIFKTIAIALSLLISCCALANSLPSFTILQRSLVRCLSEHFCYIS